MSDAEPADQEENKGPANDDVRRVKKVEVFTIETFLPNVEEKKDQPEPVLWPSVNPYPPTDTEPSTDDEKLIIEHDRNGRKWILEITIKPAVTSEDYYGNCDEPIGYVLELKPPSMPPGATVVWAPFEERMFHGTTWREVGERSPLVKSTVRDPFKVGVEVTITNDDWRSKWDFLSEERMVNWDVVFLVNATRFYAHRPILSLVSPYFEKMFTGAFREKNEKEVTLEDVDPDVFEAFLHCVYPCGIDPPEGCLLPLTYVADKFGAESLTLKCQEALKWTYDVSRVDKLQVAVKTAAPSLEDHVIESLTAEDIKALVESDVMKELGEERMAKILKKSATFI